MVIGLNKKRKKEIMKNLEYIIKNKAGEFLKRYEIDSYDKIWAVSFVNHHDFAKTFTHEEALYIAGAICSAYRKTDAVEIEERETV
jgi:hypothetical protein